MFQCDSCGVMFERDAMGDAEYGFAEEEPLPIGTCPECGFDIFEENEDPASDADIANSLQAKVEDLAAEVAELRAALRAIVAIAAEARGEEK